MAQRYLYQGVNAAFTRNSGTVTNATTAPAAFNSTYVDSYVNINSGSGASFIGDFTDGDGLNAWAVSGEVFWFRADVYYAGGTFNANPITLLNDLDQQLVRLRITASGTVQFQYNSGTLATPVWTQLGTNITQAPSARATYVFSIGIDNAGSGSHTYAVYQDNALQFSGTFSMALLTRIDAFRCGDPNTGVRLSQVLAACDISLVGSFCAALKADGAGASSGMTGVFTDVNEIAVNDGTAVTSGTAGQRTTFSIGNLPALSGLVLGAEQRHIFRGANDGGAGPQNLKSVVRNSGVDTVSTNRAGIGLAFGPLTAPYALTSTQINAAGFELGFESAT